MKLKGRIITFDPAKRTGTIEDSEGGQHIIQNGSFRRTVKIKEGDTVHFQSFNLSAGAVAQDIEPELASVFANFQTDLPR
jgi:hypothetical protein